MTTPPPAPATRWWHEFSPKEGAEIGDLRKRPDIAPPMNELGFFCPWPWEPQQLAGAPMGQHHCGYCGGMQCAGVPHIDWRDVPAEDWGPPLEDGTYPPVPQGSWEEE